MQKWVGIYSLLFIYPIWKLFLFCTVAKSRKVCKYGDESFDEHTALSNACGEGMFCFEKIFRACVLFFHIDYFHKWQICNNISIRRLGTLYELFHQVITTLIILFNYKNALAYWQIFVCVYAKDVLQGLRLQPKW